MATVIVQVMQVMWPVGTDYSGNVCYIF